MLYSAIEQSPSAELVDPDILRRYFAKFDEQFFLFCDQGIQLNERFNYFDS